MSDLLELAQRVAGWARDGEQVEAYAARSHDTKVKGFEGDVESLSSAAAEGVGIRIVTGGRQGFAWAGSLDSDVVEETLAEARDNASFASPDEFVGLAVPDGVAPADLDLWREELAAFPADRKVEMALELERRGPARGAPPRPGPSAPDTPRSHETARARRPPGSAPPPPPTHPSPPHCL